MGDGTKVASGFFGGGAAYGIGYVLGLSAEAAAIPGALTALAVWIALILWG